MILSQRNACLQAQPSHTDPSSPGHRYVSPSWRALRPYWAVKTNNMDGMTESRRGGTDRVGEFDEIRHLLFGLVFDPTCFVLPLKVAAKTTVSICCLEADRETLKHIQTFYSSHQLFFSWLKHFRHKHTIYLSASKSAFYWISAIFHVSMEGSLGSCSWRGLQKVLNWHYNTEILADVIKMHKHIQTWKSSMC